MFSPFEKKCGCWCSCFKDFFWCNKNQTQRLAMQEHNFDTLTKFFLSMGGGKVFFFFFAQLTIF